jgi:hypothetical protein
MKLYTRCTSCKNELNIVSKAPNRGKFQMMFGKEIAVFCPTCKKDLNVHVNDIKATSSGNIPLISLLISGAVMLVAFFFFGWIVVVGLSIPIGLSYQQMREVNDFNRYKIKR